MIDFVENSSSLLFFLVSLVFLGGFYWIVEKVRQRKALPDIPTFEDERIKVLSDNSIKLPKSHIKEFVHTDSTYIGSYGNNKIFIPNKTSHLFICGTTGTGKTIVLSNFIKTAFEQNMPMLIIDGKGDIGNNSIIDIVKKFQRERKVYVIDFNDPVKSDGYNPFNNTSPTVIKDMLVNLTEWSEEHYKVNAERYIQRVIELMFVSNIPLSLKTITNNMSVNSFKTLSAKLSNEKIITKEHHLQNLELAQTAGTIAEGATARFANIIENELGQIFNENGIDIYTALKEKAIIVFILKPLLYPELSTLIGKLIVIDSKKAVDKTFASNNERTFFMFDEINVYAGKQLLDLVNKSRSANITCFLATQSLSDLDSSTNDGEHFRRQVIENCNNYIILRQNDPKNSEEWAKVIGTVKTMDITYQLHSEDNITTNTGHGSAKFTREFIFHPDDIKNLKLGEGYYVNKNTGENTRVNIQKPF